MKYRIKEVFYRNGKSRFFPQNKILGLVWCSFDDGNDYTLCFDTIDKCRDFIERHCERRTTITRTGDVVIHKF